MQCKDIANADFLLAIVTACALRAGPRGRAWAHATRWDVAAVLAGHPEHVGWTPRTYPGMPENLVMAKFRKLERRGRGIVEGCDCGCRGDWCLAPNTAGALGMAYGDPGVGRSGF
jgi:hypothetical protein